MGKARLFMGVLGGLAAASSSQAAAFSELPLDNSSSSEQLQLFDVEHAEVSIIIRTTAVIRQTQLVQSKLASAAISRETIQRASPRYDIDIHLLKALVQTESGGDPHAVSRRGARGLGQIMPWTGAMYGVSPDALADPELNLSITSAELKRLAVKYRADLPLVLAAYNAGEGAVYRFGGHIPPFRETQGFVRRVTERLTRLLKAEGRSLPAGSQ